jgi:two-component system response regulator VanR
MKDIDFKFLSTLTVLYVEDEVGVREKMMLNLDGVFKEIIVAKDGDEGLDKFWDNKSRIDLIISDIKMPKRDGLSMVDQIRERSEIPVIVTTAFNEIDYLHKSISVGVSEYILKPIKVKELLKLIIKNLKKEKEDKFVEVGEFRFSFNKGELFSSESSISLTLQERKFLQLLLRDSKSTLSYETVGNELWEDYVPETTIRSLARRVRKKFPYIETVAGIGYRVSEVER